jgi:hypothetical protein
MYKKSEVTSAVTEKINTKMGWKSHFTCFTVGHCSFWIGPTRIFGAFREAIVTVFPPHFNRIETRQPEMFLTAAQSRNKLFFIPIFPETMNRALIDGIFAPRAACRCDRFGTILLGTIR